MSKMQRRNRGSSTDRRQSCAPYICPGDLVGSGLGLLGQAHSRRESCSRALDSVPILKRLPREILAAVTEDFQNDHFPRMESGESRSDIGVLVRVLQRNRTSRRLYIYIYGCVCVYIHTLMYLELAHTIVEAEKSHHLLSASCEDREKPVM